MNESCDWRKKARSAGILALRILMGFGIAYHGYYKVFGGQQAMLAEGLGKMGVPMPVLLSWCASLAEFAGGIFIAIGLGTRIAAFFVFFTMCVAFFGAHAHDPFQVKELAYMYGTVALSLMLIGGGCYSLDALFCCKKDKAVS